MRDSISLGAGFTKADSAEHNLRVARLAKVLSEQSEVVVSVIAPMIVIREQIDKTCNPIWIYLHRTLPERDGHFYEEPTWYPTINQDAFDVEGSLGVLLELLPKKYSLFIGRWQPLHDGHLALFDKVRKEGKNIAIGVRNTPLGESDPYSVSQRIDMIKEKVPDAEIVIVPDIEEIVYGRGVGYGIREIKLDDDIEKISATKIRKQDENSG